MNRVLKLAIAQAFLLCPVAGSAGTPETTTVVEQPTNITPPWQITVGGPGWLAGVSGHTGFHGVNPYVNVGIDQILRHINFIWATEAEVRKGRFGVLGDLLYLNGQAGVSPTGLVSRIGSGLQEFLGETFLSYRVIDSPRGSLDHWPDSDLPISALRLI